MSNIASGVMGLVQGQAATKGGAAKAGHAAGAGEGKDFADAIASLSGRDGGGERKGLRPAKVAQGAAELDAASGGQDRVRLSRHDGARVPDALRAAAGEADFSGKGRAEAAGRNSAIPVAERQAASKAEEVVPEGEEPDLGNLLQMLAANETAPQAGVAIPIAQATAGARETGEAGNPKQGGDARAGAAKVAADAAPVGRDMDAADIADETASDTDRIFRLIRADGKGREVEMTLSGNGEKTAFKDAASAGSKGEAVTVVDSRRYIGLAPAGSATAVTAAIAQDPEWARSLGASGGLTQHEAAATGRVVNTLKIQMNPIELGMVTATLRLHGDELVVALQVETGEAYRQLKDDQDSIVKALRAQGFAVDQVSVQLSPADRSASSQQQGDGQFQQQFSGQQQAREGGNGRQSGGEQAAGGFGQEGSSHEGSASEGGQGRAGGDPVRAGGVYL